MREFFGRVLCWLGIHKVDYDPFFDKDSFQSGCCERCDKIIRKYDY